MCFFDLFFPQICMYLSEHAFRGDNLISLTNSRYHFMIWSQVHSAVGKAVGSGAVYGSPLVPKWPIFTIFTQNGFWKVEKWYWNVNISLMYIQSICLEGKIDKNDFWVRIRVQQQFFAGHPHQKSHFFPPGGFPGH